MMTGQFIRHFMAVRLVALDAHAHGKLLPETYHRKLDKASDTENYGLLNNPACFGFFRPTLDLG